MSSTDARRYKRKRERDIKKWESVENLIVIKEKDIDLLKIDDEKIIEIIKKGGGIIGEP